MEDNKDRNTTDFVFMREQIKSRPINKGKLAKTTLISALSAVIFGIVACVTFFWLAPVVSGYLEKDDNTKENNYFVFPEETIEEETKPEDMLITNEPSIDLSELDLLSEEELAKALSSIEFTVADYQHLYQSMTSIAAEAQQSIVRVRTVKQDTDWFDNMFEETGELPGVVVAESQINYYVLSYSSMINEDDDIYITFPNEVSVKAYVQSRDSLTDLCMLFIPKININEATKNSVTVATLGVSNSSYLKGSLIIALGSPMGTYGSINFGIVTQLGKSIDVVDHNYKRITTDISGSNKATGVLVNLKGEILGIIDTKYQDSDTGNIVGAIGISELKKTIEDMINAKSLVYIGIHGDNVPEEAIYQYEAPRGAFIKTVEMDSPAMNSGIQAGDIVVEVNAKNIANYGDLVNTIRGLSPEIESEFVVCRQSPEGYKRITFTITPTVQR